MYIYIYVNEIEHENPSWNIAPNSDMVCIRANNSTAETLFHLRRKKKSETRLVNELVDFEAQTSRWFSRWFSITHDASMGRTVYLPTWKP